LNRMEYTVRAHANPRSTEDRLLTVSRGFQSMKRTAHNRLIEGKPSKAVISHLQNRYMVENWRWCQWALLDAQTGIASQTMKRRGLMGE